MSTSKLYSFEQSRKNLKHRFIRIKNWIVSYFASTGEAKHNYTLFRRRMGIPALDKLNDKESYLVDAFNRNNLYNIYWYAKRIRKEQRKLNRYYAYTLVLLIGVPIFIYLATANAQVDKGSDLYKQLMAENELSDIITVVVASLLTLHTFISAWMDQRKIVVEFSKASVSLKRIYYQIETMHFGRATNGMTGFEGRAENQQLSDAFIQALHDGIVLSQRVVDEETNRYYELRAQPTFDISKIWKSSATGAKSALNLFKSSRFKPEVTAAKLKTFEEQETERTDKIKEHGDELERLTLKIKQGRRAQERISLKLDELELKATKDRTPQEQDLIQKYEEKFNVLDDENDALEEEYERILIEKQLLEGNSN